MSSVMPWAEQFCRPTEKSGQWRPQVPSPMPCSFNISAIAHSRPLVLSSSSDGMALMGPSFALGCGSAHCSRRRGLALFKEAVAR